MHLAMRCQFPEAKGMTTRWATLAGEASHAIRDKHIRLKAKRVTSILAGSYPALLKAPRVVGWQLLSTSGSCSPAQRVHTQAFDAPGDHHQHRRCHLVRHSASRAPAARRWFPVHHLGTTTQQHLNRPAVTTEQRAAFYKKSRVLPAAVGTSRPRRFEQYAPEQYAP